jgi:hypothetical protein
MSEITMDLDFEIDNDMLTAVLEHVILPPRLPQKAPDPGRETLIERALCAFTANAALKYAHGHEEGTERQKKWKVIAKALGTFGKRASASIDLDALTQDLRTMGKDGMLHHFVMP